MPPVASGTLGLVSAPLDLQLLRTLVTVAEVSSITRASKLLGLTQSTCSLQLQRLEERLGTTLLSRSQRGVALTASGEAFIVYARRLLALAEEAERSVAAPAGGQVRLGITDVDASRYLPGVLERFAESHPGVQPSVYCDVSTALVERFERGELDVCLSIRHGGAGGELLGRDPIAWVAAADFELPDGGPIPLALYPEYCAFRARGLRALAESGRGWEIVYCSQSTAAINVAIEQGWAVAIKSTRAVEPGWRILGAGDGMPALEPVDVELRRSPARSSRAARDLAELLEAAVSGDLAGH